MESRKYPIFIPSKGRVNISGTAYRLEKVGIEDFRIVVEESELSQYADRWGRERLLILPEEYKENFDPLDGYGLQFPPGPGPARNFIWDTAEAEGHKWYWTLDDNITFMMRYGRQFKGGFQIVKNGDKWFGEMERYITQYINVAMGGPQADGFVTHRHQDVRRAVRNTRIYSFQIIRTAAPFRWRGRYNDDTVLSLDMLTSGWRTLLLYHYLMKKEETRKLSGGNTDHLYASGTGPKSRMLARVYPKYTEVKYRFGRIHHFINYKKHFEHLPLILDPEREQST